MLERNSNSRTCIKMPAQVTASISADIMKTASGKSKENDKSVTNSSFP